MLNQKSCTGFCACVVGEATNLCAVLSFIIIELDCSAKSTGKDMASSLLILLVLFTDEFNFAGGIWVGT